MGARRAVLLTHSKSIAPYPLLSHKQRAPITPLESALMQVLILNNLKLFRINTYEKHRGEGASFPILELSPSPLTTMLPYLSSSLLNSGRIQ